MAKQRKNVTKRKKRVSYRKRNDLYGEGLFDYITGLFRSAAPAATVAVEEKPEILFINQPWFPGLIKMLNVTPTEASVAFDKMMTAQMDEEMGDPVMYIVKQIGGVAGDVVDKSAEYIEAIIKAVFRLAKAALKEFLASIPTRHWVYVIMFIITVWALRHPEAAERLVKTIYHGVKKFASLTIRLFKFIFSQVKYIFNYMKRDAKNEGNTTGETFLKGVETLVDECAQNVAEKHPAELDVRLDMFEQETKAFFANYQRELDQQVPESIRPYMLKRPSEMLSEELYNADLDDGFIVNPSKKKSRKKPLIEELEYIPNPDYIEEKTPSFKQTHDTSTLNF